MKIRKHKTIKTVTEVIQHKVEGIPFRKFGIYETFVNGEHRGFTIGGRGIHDTYAEYLKPEFTIEDLKSKTFSEISQADMFSPVIDIKSIEDFDLSRVYYSYGCGHMLFDFESNLIPLIHEMCYIGTLFNNQYLYMDKALAYMKKSPLFIDTDDLEIVDIPYYNCEENNNKTFSKIRIKLDSKTYNKIYEKVKGDRSWSTRFKERMTAPWRMEEGEDYLGLFKYMKPTVED